MNLPSTMRALQFQQRGQLIEVDLPTPVPGPAEVLIRTEAATICTSDLNDIDHNPFGIIPPRVLGHEGAGRVVAVGGQTRGFDCGDRVAGHPVIPCGNCPTCRRGLSHLCQRMGHLGLDRDGTFAEYYCLRADRVRRIPNSLDFGVAALLEPVAVCIEALERGRVRPEDTLLVIGDGPFGIMIARLAASYGPKKVILIGHHPFRLQQVPESITINLRQTPDPVAEILTLNEGEGVDAAILAVGNQPGLDLGISALGARGRLVVFSSIPGRSLVDMSRVHLKELEILGACNDQNFIDTALQRLAEPKLNLKTLITHRVPLNDWPRAFDLARNSKDSALKVALVFGKDE